MSENFSFAVWYTLFVGLQKYLLWVFFFFFGKAVRSRLTRSIISFLLSHSRSWHSYPNLFFFFVLNGSREDLPTAVSLKPGFSLSYTRGSTGLMAKWHTSDAHKQGFGALEKITLIITGHIWTCPPEKQGRRSRSKRKPHPLVHSSMLCHTGAEFPHGDFQGEAAQGPWRNA